MASWCSASIASDKARGANAHTVEMDFTGVKVGKGPTRATRRTDIAGLRKFLVDLARLLDEQRGTQQS